MFTTGDCPCCQSLQETVTRNLRKAVCDVSKDVGVRESCWQGWPWGGTSLLGSQFGPEGPLPDGIGTGGSVVPENPRWGEMKCVTSGGPHMGWREFQFGKRAVSAWDDENVLDGCW